MFPVARLRGRLSYSLFEKLRTNVRENLAHVLGASANDRDLDTLTRKWFEYQQLHRLLANMLPRLRQSDLSRLYECQGLEHLDAALEAGKGVILLSSHLNGLCTFLLAAQLRRRGYKLTIALPVERDPWDRSRLRLFFDKLTGTPSVRDLIGGTYIQFNVRPIVERLGANEIVLQTGDGWHSAGFLEAEFFGRPLPFTTGMLKIAQLTGSPVVNLFVDGAPPEQMRVTMQPSFTIESGPNGKRDLADKLAAYVRQLELHIRENLPSWQHWEIANVLDTMASWPERSITERYHLG